MTDRDAFELRVHAAVRDYAGRVSSDLDPVELAHRIAAGELRRRGFATTLGWRSLAVPRVAWALLLLAALLSAVVAGMLIVGSQPMPRLPAVLPPVGTRYACPPGSTPDEPGPVDQARPFMPSQMVFDRRAGKLVALSGLSGPDIYETWTFDVCTNTWTRMRPVPEIAGTGRGFVYDVDSDLTIMVSSSGDVWAYDLQADTWTMGQAEPLAVGPRRADMATPGGSAVACQSTARRRVSSTVRSSRCDGHPTPPRTDVRHWRRCLRRTSATHSEPTRCRHRSRRKDSNRHRPKRRRWWSVGGRA